jgi:hypothetical protein
VEQGEGSRSETGGFSSKCEWPVPQGVEQLKIFDGIEKIVIQIEIRGSFPTVRVNWCNGKSV